MREIGLWGTPEAVAKITFKDGKRYTIEQIEKFVQEDRLEHVGGNGRPIVVRYVVLTNETGTSSELRLTERQAIS
jgi:hypothetical protein